MSPCAALTEPYRLEERHDLALGLVEEVAVPVAGGELREARLARRLVDVELIHSARREELLVHQEGLLALCAAILQSMQI